MMTETGPQWKMPGTLVFAALITAALYWAQDVFIPLALAALLSFLLTPLCARLERRGLKRSLAVLLITLQLSIVIAISAVLLSYQVIDLAEKLPNYRGNLEQKLQSANGRAGATISRVIKMYSDFGQRTPEAPKPNATSDVTAHPLAAPARVTVVTRDTNPLELIEGVISPLLAPLGKTAIVIILVIFMLIEREEMRDRLIRLAGTTHMHVTTQALDDAGERVSRYLLMQVMINSVYGACAAIGLYFIGVPNALMWGLLATVFRFLPYLGFWIAASIPFLLALASPTWYQPILTLCLFGTLELVTNNLEPGLYGSSTGLSSIAVLAAALFWGWLWGPVGLLLSTPLTVVLVVLGKHVPYLSFLNVILGDEPALEPHVRLYQRMLATDSEEAEDIFEEFTGGKTLTEAYDTIALPALEVAGRDFHSGDIDETRWKLVYENMNDLVQALGVLRSMPGIHPPLSEETTPSRLASVPTICFPARDEADEIAGTMLAQIVHESGAELEVVSVTNLAGEMLAMIEQRQAEVICISALPPSSVRHARYLYKRIRAKFPEIPIVIVLWSSKLNPEKAKRLLGCKDDDIIATTAAEAAKHILRHVDICSLRKQAAIKTVANSDTLISA